MGYSDDTLNDLFDAAGGVCPDCGRTIRWKHYGSREYAKGWEVDHIVPKARGGSNRRRNLWALCWECNAKKGAGT